MDFDLFGNKTGKKEPKKEPTQKAKKPVKILAEKKPVVWVEIKEEYKATPKPKEAEKKPESVEKKAYNEMLEKLASRDLHVGFGAYIKSITNKHG